jgi:orotate phosphoribosyltransferase
MIDRMFFQPEFTGKVLPGKYILVDDVFTTGITLKGLKTYIENCGGNVVSAYTLGSSKSTLFEASKLQMRILKSRYPEVEKYFDLSLLTIIQIEYLLKFNSIRNLNILYSENHFQKQFS